MKIDNLVPVFARAYWRCPMQDCEEAYEVGVRAVVEALRDEFREEYGMWERFSQILGDAGAEKVAGGSTREDEQAAQPSSTTPATPKDEEHFGITVGREFPATDPAPAVCVWNTVAQGWEYDIVKRSCTGSEFRVYGSGEHTCPSCKAPIKFTEAKT